MVVIQSLSRQRFLTEDPVVFHDDVIHHAAAVDAAPAVVSAVKQNGGAFVIVYVTVFQSDVDIARFEIESLSVGTAVE